MLRDWVEEDGLPHQAFGMSWAKRSVSRMGAKQHWQVSHGFDVVVTSPHFRGRISRSEKQTNRIAFGYRDRKIDGKISVHAGEEGSGYICGRSGDGPSEALDSCPWRL